VTVAQGNAFESRPYTADDLPALLALASSAMCCGGCSAPPRSTPPTMCGSGIAATGHRADLDLVTVLPDGAFASYCIC